MSTIEKKHHSIKDQGVDQKFLYTIHQHIDKILSKQNPPYTISCSGGIDSTALLHLMAILYDPDQLKILYVNHNLRSDGELKQEISLIQSYGASLGIPVYIETVEIGAIDTLCKQEKMSPEEGARYYRYALFQKHIDTHGGAILLGHTEDDQIETVIHRFFQGAGVEGLCGIAEERGYIVRPLLGVSKCELRQFLLSQQVSWSEDSTNKEDLYLRNRMRNHLIPELERVFPGYKRALLQGRQKMLDLQEECSRWDGMLPTVEVYKDSVAVEVESFLGLSRWGKFRLLCTIWNHPKSWGKGELSYQSILPLLRNDFSQDGVLYGSQSTLWEWKKGLLFLSKLVAPSVKKGYFNRVQSRKTPLFGQYCLELYSGAPQKGEIWLPPCVGETPLVVRSYLSGDTIDLVDGTKHIKELYNHWSVPVDRRWEIPLLVDTHGVIAVLGKPFGYVNRVSKRMVYNEKQPIIAVVRKE